MRCKSRLLCMTLLLSATANGAMAKTLVFAGTSIKELPAPGEKWGSQTAVVLNEPGEGFRYSDSGDEVGVIGLSHGGNKFDSAFKPHKSRCRGIYTRNS